MNKALRIFSLMMSLCLMLSGAGSAETKLLDPVAIVRYDREALIDWTPSYSLNMPGVLLELAHAEAMLSVMAVEAGGLSADEYLSDRLDRAGETLSVSDAVLSEWETQSGVTGRLLSYAYTYPEGDEVHLFSSWVRLLDGMLIDLTVDAWGEEAELLMETAETVFAEGGIALSVSENAVELTGTLSDLMEVADAVSVQLNEPGEAFHPDAPFYRLAEDAVVLFPNPDDPALLYPVGTDMASLVDAVLTYEESSDSPAVFRTIIENDQIIYMEYGLMQ